MSHATRPPLVRLAVLFSAWACLLVTANSTAAGAVNPPVRIAVTPTDGDRLLGWVTAYDEDGFDMDTRGGDTARVEWADLSPKDVYEVNEKVLPRDDGPAWLNVAVVLFASPGGEVLGEKALRRALRADPALSDKADRVRNGEPLEDPPPAEAGDADGHEAGEGPAGHAHEGDGEATGGPVVVGDLQSQFWGELSPELMAESVEALKKEAEEAQKKLRVRLQLYEDDNFLFYTDLDPAEARRWAGLLDSMYARLVDMFDLPRDKNVFRGKCLIYVFSRESDYHRYWGMAWGVQSQGSAGMCMSRGDGFVNVSFYRQANTLNFAYILVHESVHAFVHRYRSYPFVASWINEGLAEYIAHRLVNNSGFGESDWASRMESTRSNLRRLGSMGGMFDMGHIQGWQYPVAYEVTAFMIGQSATRYQAFINAIKDGKPWEQALEEDYGLTRDQLVEAFGESIRVRGLKP